MFETPLDSIPDLVLKYFQFKTVVDKKSYEINFEHLFKTCRDEKFIVKTNEFYNVENSKLSFEQIVELQFRLAKNCWYQYFKQHVRDVKTWIDFEQKIEEVLNVIALFVLRLETTVSKYGLSSSEIVLDSSDKSSIGKIFLTREYCNILELLKIIKSGYYDYRKVLDEETGEYYLEECEAEYDEEDNGSLKFHIENDYASYKNGSYKVRVDKIISRLHEQLDEFIEIFNLYLELIVDKLEPKSQFKIEAESWVKPDHIFSFNYTDTFRKFYQSEVKAEFLHGRFGKKQNIVLGISDLEDEGLKKLKAYGFTKYHQKLFKDTDYLFLDESSSAMKGIQGARPNLVNNNGTKILIWGHSLDKSDQEYIKEIFKLNDQKDIGVKVIVYCFNDQAKFDLLNNLLNILEKDKVEKWMKNKWLTFEENPKVRFAENISEQTV